MSSTPEAVVIEQMAAVNLTGLHPADLVVDGKIHRFKPEWEKKEKRGWYVLFDFYTDNKERLISGSFGWWKGAYNNSYDVDVSEESSAIPKLTDSERERLAKEHAAKRAQAEKEAESVRKAAAKKAKSIFEKLLDSGASEYLDRKGVRAWGVRFSRGVIVIPVVDMAGDVHGLQFIQASGEKKFLTGTNKKGHFHVIGTIKDDKPILFAEGYATAASLYQATRFPVVVTFDAGNMPLVGKEFRTQYPESQLVFCGDDDASSATNAGRQYAEEAARLVDGVTAFPPQLSDTVGKVDWNDFYLANGFEAVQTELNKTIGDFAARNSVFPTACENTPRDSAPPAVCSFAGFEAELDAVGLNIVDVIELTKRIQLSKLHPAECEFLLKRAAKQVGVSVASLKMDKPKETVTVTGNGTGRPIERQDDFVDELNGKHWIVPVGGRTFIMNREYDPALKRPMYTFSGKQDFVLRYANRKTWKNGDMVDIATAWLEHSDRLQYEGIVFSPNGDVDDYYNLFQGFGIQPKQGDCEFFMDFIYVVICNRNMELYEYLWQWLGHLFQKPDELPGTAFVLRGKEGIGKNTFVECIGKLVGLSHFIQLSSIQQVVGRFSGHLMDKLLVFANEAIWGGDKQAEGTLKHIISDDISTVEYKGKDIFSIKNYKRLIAASNEDWVIPRGLNDRRWIVCDVSAVYQENQDYFSGIKQKLNNGGYEALMYEFMTMDLSNFNPRCIPIQLREAGWELKIRSGGSVLQWWFYMLENGYMKEEQGHDNEPTYLWLVQEKKQAIHQLYLTWCEKHRIAHPEMDCVMGKRLKEFGVTDSRPRSKGHVPHYNFQSLKDSRARFSEILGIPLTHWTENETE